LDLDCVSAGELAVARQAGIDVAALHLHGNAKPRSEIRQAIEWGIGRIIVDSLDELETLGELTAGRAIPQPILLRLNPGVDVHTHAHIQTGQLDSKFGLPIATGMAETAMRRSLELPGIRLIGLHMHLGSQIAELAPLATACALLFRFAAAMKAAYGWQMAEFSPGGGLAVPYTSQDPAPAIDDYVERLATATLHGAREAGLAPPHLVIEPGRSLIARAVVALYTVVATKAIPDVRTFVAVDGGMGDNIRPALYGARYHAVCAERCDAEPSELVTIAGRYCESGDILLRDVMLPRIDPGDHIAIPVSGAYTLSMASAYNLVPRPALLLLREGRSYPIQRRETFEDLYRRDLALPAGSEDAKS
jgi:diaminopimelate decarboxylase